MLYSEVGEISSWIMGINSGTIMSFDFSTSSDLSSKSNKSSTIVILSFKFTSVSEIRDLVVSGAIGACVLARTVAFSCFGFVDGLRNTVFSTMSKGESAVLMVVFIIVGLLINLVVVGLGVVVVDELVAIKVVDFNAVELAVSGEMSNIGRAVDFGYFGAARCGGLSVTVLSCWSRISIIL